MGRIRIATLALCACAAATAMAAERTYRWVDQEGNIHYGDSVPAEYADHGAEIFNERGIQVGTIEGRKTPEQLAAEALIRADEERRAEQERMDRVLLDTYTNVEEIQILRDRRLELLDARARVTEQYLENLRARLARLEQQSAAYQGEDGGAALPEKLAEDMIQTMTSISNYEQRLADARTERARLFVSFQDQIARYRELVGIDDIGEPTAGNTPRAN